MYWKQGAALSVALTLAAAGCGGSKPLTHAEFVKQASAVCEQTQAKGIALLKLAAARKTAQHLSEAQFAAELRPKVAALRGRQLKQLEALRAPDALKATFVQWKQMLDEEAKAGPVPSSLTPAGHARLVARVHHREQLVTRLSISPACS